MIDDNEGSHDDVEEPFKQPLIQLAKVEENRETQIKNMTVIFIKQYGGKLQFKDVKKKVTSNLVAYMYYHGYEQDEKAQMRDSDNPNGGKNARKRYRTLIDRIWQLYEKYCLFQHPGL